MNNKPVAWIKEDTLTYLGNYNYASITIQVQKSKSVGFDIPLYTHPVKELTPCEELRAFQEKQNGVFSDHNACCYRHECRIVWNDWEKLRSNPVELTDEEILELSDKYLVSVQEYIGCGDYISLVEGEIEFARAILRKAQENEQNRKRI